VILDTGFQSSLLQSFATACWILEISGSNSLGIQVYPASSIQHRRGKNDGHANTKHEEIKIFMQRWG
jgi:hypothetical protein